MRSLLAGRGVVKWGFANLGNKKPIVHPCWFVYVKYMLKHVEKNLSSLIKMFFWLCDADLQPCILIILWNAYEVQSVYSPVPRKIQ